MQAFDPGHFYRLDIYDSYPGDCDCPRHIRFVKRVGQKYPGNTNPFSGTTSQEVMRVLIERAQYVNGQKFHWVNHVVIFSLAMCIYLLELRHHWKMGRLLMPRLDLHLLPTCPVCGHVLCEEHQEEQK